MLTDKLWLIVNEASATERLDCWMQTRLSIGEFTRNYFQRVKGSGKDYLSATAHESTFVTA